MNKLEEGTVLQKNSSMTSNIGILCRWNFPVDKLEIGSYLI